MVKDNNQLVTKKILWETLTDFFDKVIAPYFEKIEGKLVEHDKRFERIDERFDKLDERLDRHGTQLDNHEERLEKLETPLVMP